MSDNLIFMVNVDDPKSKVRCKDYSKYSMYSWHHYCKRHRIDFVMIGENEGEFEFPIWNKELIHRYGERYGKIGIVDSDTIVRWDAPNIFDQVNEDGIYGVNDLCDLNWLLESVGDRQRFFPDVNLDLTKYINAGVLFFRNKHLSLFKELLEFYLENKEEIHAIKGGGKEQTLLNFTIQKKGIPVNLLSQAWNLLSIHRKNMFTHNWQLKVDLMPYFIKYAYVWHYTGFPFEDRVRLMRETWELIKENYE